jgi:hypothetical protein
MLAMVVNDDAGCLITRVARTFIASMLAPTGDTSTFFCPKKNRPCGRSKSCNQSQKPRLKLIVIAWSSFLLDTCPE